MSSKNADNIHGQHNNHRVVRGGADGAAVLDGRGEVAQRIVLVGDDRTSRGRLGHFSVRRAVVSGGGREDASVGTGAAGFDEPSEEVVGGDGVGDGAAIGGGRDDVGNALAVRGVVVEAALLGPVPGAPLAADGRAAAVVGPGDGAKHLDIVGADGLDGLPGVVRMAAEGAGLRPALVGAHGIAAEAKGICRRDGRGRKAASPGSRRGAGDGGCAHDSVISRPRASKKCCVTRKEPLVETSASHTSSIAWYRWSVPVWAERRTYRPSRSRVHRSRQQE